MHGWLTADFTPARSLRDGALNGRFAIHLAVSALLTAVPARADDALAERGFAVLATHCIRCHGVEFNTPGLNMFVRDTMLSSPSPGKAPFLVPGKARESAIFLHAAGLRQNRMPPEEEPRPTEDEIRLLEEWIDAGADYPKADRPPRPFVGERQLISAVVADIEQQPEARQPYLRYFTIGHLWNDPSTGDDALAVTRAAISKLVNSLSSQRRIVPPVAIGPDGLVLRIDMRDYGWTERTHWLPMLARYPYGLVHDDALARRLYRAAASDLPYVRGDWFCFHAARPELYHRLATLPARPGTGHAGLPESRQTLEQLLAVDLAANFSQDRIMRAGMTGEKSGVSDHNRIVERHDMPFGYYWISYDSAGSSDRQNHANFPLGPRLANVNPLAAFDHDGGEIIFSLPNGLQAYLLVNASGGRIDEGPPEIVQDKARHSGTFKIVNAISCMGCHREGMIGFSDSIRPLYEGKADGIADKVRRIYPASEDMARAVTQDREQFLSSLRQAVEPFLHAQDGSTLDMATLPEPITDVSKRYERDLGVADVARELGLPSDRQAAQQVGMPVSAEELAAAIRVNDRLRQLELGPLAAGEKIKRSQWERSHQRASRELGLGLPFEVQ